MGSSLRVILDSNFLMMPFQFGVDIFAELERILDVKYEIYVTNGVLKELERLSRSEGKTSKYAKEALGMAEKLRAIETKSLDVDEGLLELALQGAVICTNDKALRERIRKSKSSVIYLRQKKYLALKGYLN